MSTSEFPKNLEMPPPLPEAIEPEIEAVAEKPESAEAAPEAKANRLRALQSEYKELEQAYSRQLTDELRDEFLKSPGFVEAENALLQEALEADKGGKEFDSESKNPLIFAGTMLKYARGRLTPDKISAYESKIDKLLITSVAERQAQELGAAKAFITEFSQPQEDMAMLGDTKMPRALLLRLIGTKKLIDSL